MEYQFTIDQENYKVDVKLNSNGLYTAKIGDEIFELEAIPITPDHLLLLMGDTSFSIFYTEAEKNAVISVRGQQFTVAHSRDRGKGSRDVSAPDRAQVEKKITAPMPGRILKVLVKEKQTVKIHQPLFIVESMKMENEVQSPKAGKVVKINFKENDLVSVGDAVIELDD